MAKTWTEENLERYGAASPEDTQPRAIPAIKELSRGPTGGDMERLSSRAGSYIKENIRPPATYVAPGSAVPDNMATAAPFAFLGPESGISNFRVGMTKPAIPANPLTKFAAASTSPGTGTVATQKTVTGLPAAASDKTKTTAPAAIPATVAEEPTAIPQSYGDLDISAFQQGHNFTNADLSNLYGMPDSGIPRPNTEEYSKWSEGERARSNKEWGDIESSQRKRDVSEFFQRALNGQIQGVDPLAVAKAYGDFVVAGRQSDLESAKIPSAIGYTEAQMKKDIADALKTTKEAAILPPDYETAIRGEKELEGVKHPTEKTTMNIGDIAKAAIVEEEDTVTGVKKKYFDKDIFNALKSELGIGGGQQQGAAPAAKPTWEQFRDAVRQRGSKMSDQELRAYYNQKYGRA